VNLEDWKSAGRFALVDGRRIFFREAGSGPPLLLVHGFPTSSWDWEKLWPALEARFRVVAPDMLGFGFSDKPQRHRYSLVEQATLHERLLQQLGVADPHVLCHDYGVSVLQELLARQLDSPAPALRLRSVTFLNGGLFPEQHRPRPVQVLLAGPLGPLVSRLMTRRSFGSSFSAVFAPAHRPSPRDLDQFWQAIEHGGGARIAHRLMAYLADRRLHRDRWVSALQKTPVPLRLINGPLDPVSGAHMAARYRELVPGADVVSLEGVGHYPQLEAPERVLAALFEHLERRGGLTA
jgi:pimeloyl-ACP methyl ester carboxylesterase